VRLPGPPGAGPLLLLPGGRTLLAGTADGSVAALPWPGTFPAGPDLMAGTGRVREQRLHGAPLTHMLLCPGTNAIVTARWVQREGRAECKGLACNRLGQVSAGGAQQQPMLIMACRLAWQVTHCL
jgi:hypothetical protein